MRIEDIAKILGVSKSTVSLALNNKPGVNQETRNRVLETVKISGYTSKHLHKIKEKNKTIRFMVVANPEIITSENRIYSSFFSEVIHGLENECNKLGLSLVFSAIELKDFEEQIKKIEYEHVVEGTILLGTNLSQSELEIASKNLQNLVVLDTYFELINVNFIVMNNIMGGYKACSFFINQGHRDIGYIQFSHRTSNCEFRKKGFMYAIKENNLNITKENFFAVRNEISLAEIDFMDIITRQGDSLPGAFFCESDYIAIGVIKALNKQGKKVPDDISIIGFDNVPESSIISPELTTIDVNKREMGALAVQRLYYIINNSNKQLLVNSTITNTYLIERKSCKTLNKL